LSKKLFVIFLIFFFFFSSYRGTGYYYNDSVIESIDLSNAQGTLANPYIYNLTQDYTTILKLQWQMNFTALSLNLETFADDSTLPNGFIMYYNRISLTDGDTLRSNSDFIAYSYDHYIDENDKASNDKYIGGQWLFNTWVDGGLQITPSKTFQIYVQDNISLATSLHSFLFIIKGYKTIYNTYFDLPDYYYPHAINNIGLINLLPGEELAVHFNNSFGLDYWVNQTIFESNVIIKLNLEYITNNMTSIDIYLYESNVFKDSATLLVQPVDYQPATNWLSYLMYGVLFFAAGFFVFKLISSEITRRGG